MNIITDTATGEYLPSDSTQRSSLQGSDGRTLKHSRGAHEYRVRTHRTCAGRSEHGSMPGEDECRPT